MKRVATTLAERVCAGEWLLEALIAAILSVGAALLTSAWLLYDTEKGVKIEDVRESVLKFRATVFGVALVDFGTGLLAGLLMWAFVGERGAVLAAGLAAGVTSSSASLLPDPRTKSTPTLWPSFSARLLWYGSTLVAPIRRSLIENVRSEVRLRFNFRVQEYIDLAAPAYAGIIDTDRSHARKLAPATRSHLASFKGPLNAKQQKLEKLVEDISSGQLSFGQERSSLLKLCGKLSAMNYYEPILSVMRERGFDF